MEDPRDLMEPPVKALSEASPKMLIGTLADISIAISLKRIADELTNNLNQYGETPLKAVGEAIRRADPNGRY